MSFAFRPPIVSRMTGCLTIEDITGLGREPIDELKSTAEALDPQHQDSCAIFARQVVQVETVLKQTYKAAALMARRTETPEQEAEIWRDMRKYSEAVIGALKELKETYPRCGTPELYTLASGYWDAAASRLSRINESIQCQSLPMPDGLFPRMT